VSIKDKKIGFIGLGTMGAPMARNIKKAGFSLGVYNRTESRAEAFRDEGAAVYYAPWELAEDCDIIIIMVTGPEALLEITGAIQEVLKTGKTVINMSTVSIDATMQAAEIVQSRGAEFVDAPVSGSKKPAEEGALVILAGADSRLLDELQPLFESMGRDIVCCGEVGYGTRMKLVINMLLGNMMASFAEALVFGRRTGLAFETILQTITAGALGSPLFKIKGQAISEGNYTKNFPVDLIFKDLNLVLHEAGKVGTPLPLASATREAYSGTVGLGLGNEDMAALVKYYEKIADIKIVDGGK